MGIVSKALSAWNAFRANDEMSVEETAYSSPSFGFRPDRTRLRFANEKSIHTAILTRIAVDASGVELRHVKVDGSGRYSDDVDSKLNDVLSLEANLDQAPRHFRQDIVTTMFDKGLAAIVPIDMTVDEAGNIKNVYSARVGEVTDWKPNHVRVRVYNERRGTHQEILIEKRKVALVENPFYNVMNQPNSTLQRLLRKLSLLDSVDEQSSSGKLDLIIQLPYVVKSDARRQQAEDRRKDIELQLSGSKYGIAYTDGTEKITQLNRPIENNLMKQIEFLTTMLYGQLGVTAEIMNGTADEKVMLNYFDRTIEPIVDAVCEAMRRTFVGYKRDERIIYFRNPFKLVPLSEVADIVDKLSRNEVLSPNEIRGFLGIRPSSDPKADELKNSNMPPYEAMAASSDAVGTAAMSGLEEIEGTVTEIFKDLGV